MACSEQSLVVGTSVTKHFNERHSQLSELVKEDVDIHFAPAQATGRPDISGGAGGGEPLTLLSLTTPEPHQETVIADTNWPPSSMVVSGTPAAPQRLNTPQDTSKEEPPLSSEQEDKDDSGKHSAGVVYQPPSHHPIAPLIEPERPQAGAKKCFTKGIIICLVMTISTILLTVCSVTLLTLGLGMVLPNNQDQISHTSLLQILPDDTVLLYQGTSQNIDISEIVPPLQQKPNIQLYIVDCSRLIKHEEHYPFGNRTRQYDQNIAKPILPSYPHYEVGSTFNFSIAVLNATVQSSLSVVMFDNKTKADDYTSNPTPQTGREAIKSWSIATNDTTKNLLYFSPSYGGYFVPVFSIETNGLLEIQYSYAIIQQFYLNTDYVGDEYKNCSLMDNETCSLSLKHSENQSCILAYRKPSQDVYEGSVDLQTVTESSQVTIPHFKPILVIAGSTLAAIGGSGVVVSCIIVLVLVLCQKRCCHCGKKDDPAADEQRQALLETLDKAFDNSMN